MVLSYASHICVAGLNSMQVQGKAATGPLSFTMGAEAQGKMTSAWFAGSKLAGLQWLQEGGF